MKRMILAVFVAGLVAVPGMVFGAVEAKSVEQQVRHELLMLPYFGVFDNLEYSVNDGTVTLTGQVTRPTLQRDAANAVKRIAGVREVVNKIEVLPLSNFDNQLRVRAYYAIYGQAALSRYAISAQPPIRIIVKNGHITLAGAVNNELERQVAFTRASGVAGAFSVTNHLRVDTAIED